MLLLPRLMMSMVYDIIVSVLFLFFVWCPCMAINASILYNGRYLPHVMLLINTTKEPILTHDEVAYF